MKFILLTNIILTLGTVLTGLYIFKKDEIKGKLKYSAKMSIGLFSAVMLMGVALLVPDLIYAAEDTAGSSDGNGLGFIAAALCTGLATIGAGYAVGAVGSSALGAVSEDPKILGKTLIFVGLAEGIAIYGLIISILILGRL